MSGEHHLADARREAEEALALGHTDCVVCCHAVEQEALAERKRLRGLRAPRRLTGYSDVHCDDCKAVVRLEVALRSLLAALTAEGEATTPAAELAIRESGLMGSTGEGHAMTAQAKPDPLGVECIYCGALKGKRCLVNPGAHRHLLQYRNPHAARVRLAEKEKSNG